MLHFLIPIERAYAQAQVSLTNINTNIPTPPGLSGGNGAGNYIYNIYTWILYMCGLLALIAVVVAGVQYAASAGNSGKQADAKDRIRQAFIGILLLMSCYLVLNTLSPDLVRLRLPTLSPFGGGTSGGGGTSDSFAGCAGGECQTLPNCTESSHTHCGGAPAMVTMLNCINSKLGSSQYYVTEGYPTTLVGLHLDSCHNNGCCVDTKVSGTGASVCTQVNALMSAARDCGATSVLNEYAQAGCQGAQTFPSTTGDNIHIRGC